MVLKLMADAERKKQERLAENERRIRENASHRVVEEPEDFASEMSRVIEPLPVNPDLKNKATLHHSEMRRRGLSEAKPQQIPDVDDSEALDYIDRQNLILHAISQPLHGKPRDIHSISENVRLLYGRMGDELLYYIPELEEKDLTVKDLNQMIAVSDRKVEETKFINPEFYKDYIPSVQYKGVLLGEGRPRFCGSAYFGES
jgi:hypothetical protein